MQPFSKFYTFGAIEIRLFFHGKEEIVCAATIGVNKDAAQADITSDKSLGLRLGEALRGTLARIDGEHKAEDLDASLYNAGRAALVELAAAIGLKKDTKRKGDEEAQ